MSTVRRALVPVLALAMLVAAAPAAARTDVSSASPGPLRPLIAASKKESGLVFYGNPPSANWKVVTDRFQYYYPWIKTTSYDLDNNVIFSKYASEAAQKIRTADVLVSSAGNLWVYATRQGYLDKTFVPNDLGKYPSFVQQYKGVFVLSPDPAINVYNKLLLKDKVPTSVTAIANDPATYSKVTGYTVDNLFGYTGIWGYVQKKGWGTLQTIGKDRMRATTGVSSQLQLVSQGGAVAAFLTSPTARFTIANSPSLQNILGWTYIMDAQPLIPRGIGVTTKASSPASAKLFLHWVYSKAGQQALCDGGFTASRTDYTPKNCLNTLAEVYKRVGKENVVFSPFSQKFVNDYPRFKVRWHGIFG
ncbi:MAG: ABC transporter substrate-binding protein [Actinobacteria bacterium]|nr:ABC transporter substrate-binding protein [Actinomycetota bacterium]